MSVRATWAGVIVTNLERSAGWYEQALGCRPREGGEDWVLLAFSDGSRIELYENDPLHPGLVFPSYGADPGPPVMPGLAVEDPEELAASLSIARQLPDWIVVVAPDGLRLVLTVGEPERSRGLLGFRCTSPEATAQRAFFADLGFDCAVHQGPRPLVAPIVAGPDNAELTDPDGNLVVTAVAAP